MNSYTNSLVEVTSPSAFTISESKDAPYLLFESRGVLWGVDAGEVCEVLLLPEIAPLDGAPWWVGVLDVRGRIVPIIEPGELAGATPRRFQTTDSVVIVNLSHGELGIVVEGVRDVRPIFIKDDEVTPGGAVSRLARVDGEIVRLLNLEYFSRFMERDSSALGSAPSRPFCPEASPSERIVFLERARALNEHPTDEAQDVGAPSLVAVRVGDEVLGIELNWVREFAERSPVTPVPGAPTDLLGLVNLRGEVVPLLDLRPSLGLPVVGDAGSQITFVECDGVHVGIAVEAVLDVFAPREGELLTPPAASNAKDDAVKAAIFYQDATLAVLNLRKLLHQGGWTTRNDSQS